MTDKEEKRNTLIKKLKDQLESVPLDPLAIRDPILRLIIEAEIFLLEDVKTTEKRRFL